MFLLIFVEKAENCSYFIFNGSIMSIFRVFTPVPNGPHKGAIISNQSHYSLMNMRFICILFSVVLCGVVSLFLISVIE